MSIIIPYKEDFEHHQHRRKRNHDYREPWKYHITIGKHPDCPDFSVLKWERLLPEEVDVRYTAIGRQISKAIKNIPAIEPRMQVYQYKIMPDHIHLLVHVKERMPRLLGEVIHDFKSLITSSLRNIMNDGNLKVFTPNFNDKIIYPDRSLNDIYDYIRQNPYRLAVRRARPAFFRKHRNILAGGREVQAYGNLFHLRNPFKYPLIVHRADDERSFRGKLEECLYHSLNGGVIVSAFISQREKEIRKAIEQAGGRIILIHDRPLAEKEKPAKHDFDLCCEGRLLMISPVEYLSIPKSDHPSRTQCLDMNSLASSIAEAKP